MSRCFPNNERWKRNKMLLYRVAFVSYTWLEFIYVSWMICESKTEVPPTQPISWSYNETETYVNWYNVIFKHRWFRKTFRQTWRLPSNKHVTDEHQFLVSFLSLHLHSRNRPETFMRSNGFYYKQHKDKLLLSKKRYI